MKKLLLLLTLLIVGVTSALAAETVTIDFTPNSTSGLPTSAVKSEKSYTFKDTDKKDHNLSLYQTFWQKNKDNSYIAFKKGEDGYIKIDGFDKPIAKISLFLPSNVTTKTKFKVALNETEIGEVALTSNGQFFDLDVPASKQTFGTIIITTANKDNQIGLGKITVTYADGPQEQTLGDIVAKVGTQAVTDGSTLTAAENDLLSISCENATSITVKDNTGDSAEYTDAIALTPGEHNFVITATDGTDTKTLTFTVNVSAKLQEALLEFDVNAPISKNIGDPDFDIAYTYVGGDACTATAVSDNEDVVKVLSATDGIVKAQVVGAGTAKITLTISADGYETATADCTVNVKDPNATEGTATFDFVNNTYGWPVESGTSKNYLKKDDSITNENVTLTVTTGNTVRIWKATSGQEFRVNSGGSIKLSVPNGYTITKIEVDGAKFFFDEISGDNKSTWSGEAQEVKLLASTTQRKVKKITVTYKTKGTEEPKELGELIVKVNDKPIADNDELTEEAPATISFRCENAEKIIVADINSHEMTYSSEGSWTIEEAEENMFTITASLGEDKKELTFSLTVTAPVAPTSYINVATPVTFDFVANGESEYGLTPKTGQSEYEKVITSIEVNGVNLAMTGNYRLFKNDNEELDYRQNSGSTLTVSAPAGTMIQKIEFVKGNGSSFNCSVDGTKVNNRTWEAETPAKSVKFDFGGTSTMSLLNVTLVMPEPHVSVADGVMTITVADDAHKFSKYAIENLDVVESTVMRAPAADAWTNVEGDGKTMTHTITPNSNYNLYVEVAHAEHPHTAQAVWAIDSNGNVTGIDTIVSDANAPVEYYTLQGIRIANPEAGQIVIRRQGTQVSKMIMR